MSSKFTVSAIAASIAAADLAKLDSERLGYGPGSVSATIFGVNPESGEIVSAVRTIYRSDIFGHAFSVAATGAIPVIAFRDAKSKSSALALANGTDKRKNGTDYVASVLKAATRVGGNFAAYFAATVEAVAKSKSATVIMPAASAYPADSVEASA